MNAAELEREVAARVGELKAMIAELKSEDRTLLVRLDAVNDKATATADDHRDLDHQVAQLRQENAVLSQQVSQLRADFERWGNRAFAIILVLTGAVATATLTTLLALAGIKK